MTQRIETQHILNGIIFTLSFFGYDTVSKQLTKNILAVLEWAAHNLLLPEDIEVRIINTSMQGGADGHYIADPIIRSNKALCVRGQVAKYIQNTEQSKIYKAP